MKYLPIVVVTCAMLVTGCALDRYQAATPRFTDNAGTPVDADVVVLLEPVFPGKPFSEIVCDNATGVSWNPDESQHIGFTQHYASSLAKNGPQIAMLAALPAPLRVGMSASGTLAPINIDSRILIPFGRYIKDNLVQALGSNGQVCDDGECVRLALQARPQARFVSVHFTRFRVAEPEPNMLRLEIEATAKVTRADATTTEVPIRHLVKRSITSEGRWHSDFLRVINKVANENSSAVVEQIRAAGI